MSDQHPLIKRDSYFLLKVGHLIETWYVDFRVPACRTPITRLIKAGEKQFAPQEIGTIRITRPDQYRHHGETLISDPNEARISRVTSYTERVNDPKDLAQARLRDEEANRTAELVGSTLKQTTTGIRRTNKRTTTYTYGKNGWLFCTGEVPFNQAEKDAFCRAMDPKYDHSYEIHEPTAFALALSALVAGQLGPRGNQAKLDSKIGGVASKSCHKMQSVFHGPVIYTEDPYKLITNARPCSEITELLLPVFTKSAEYQDQREYRFLIFSETEPPEHYVDLDVSTHLRILMHGRNGGPRTNVVRRTGSLDRIADRDSDDIEVGQATLTQKEPTIAFMSGKESDGLPDLLDFVGQPDVPIRPHLSGSDSLVDSQLLKGSVLQALRWAIEKVPDEYLTGAASAAFHAEPLLCALCDEFQDPVRTVAIFENSFILINLNIATSQGEANIAVGPLGEATVKIKGKDWESHSRINFKRETYVSPSLGQELRRAGVKSRR